MFRRRRLEGFHAKTTGEVVELRLWEKDEKMV